MPSRKQANGEGQATKGRVLVESDSDCNRGSESDISIEEEEYDLNQDPQLHIDMDKRLLDMKVGCRLEYYCDTDQGFSWFLFIVRANVDQK